METPNLPGLESLTDIGLRGGVDMRPTLLRVLTDLYVQKLTHTPEEERHYTELALRLLDSVDVATRSAVAARLAHHLSPPRQVIERLGRDLPEVVAALRSPAPPQTLLGAARPTRTGSGPQGGRGSAPQTSPALAPAQIGADTAGELNELFFAAAADERRLILLNLDIVTARQTGGIEPHHDSTIGPRLEAAALARKREEFAQVLAQALRISLEQAHRIAGDELGEPIVVAAKALAVARDLLYRILLFVNPAVGHSVERVHALAALYDEISTQAALDLVAVWQALDEATTERGATYRPLLAPERSGSSQTATARRPAGRLGERDRREAS